MLKKLFIGAIFFIIGACSLLKDYGSEGKINYIAAPPCYVNTPLKISLINPMNKYTVHCYSTPSISSEECAIRFERQGYVRYRDIPYKTANYDFLHRETYPTRRWREDERTPRW